MGISQERPLESMLKLQGRQSTLRTFRDEEDVEPWRQVWAGWGPVPRLPGRGTGHSVPRAVLTWWPSPRLSPQPQQGRGGGAAPGDVTRGELANSPAALSSQCPLEGLSLPPGGARSPVQHPVPSPSCRKSATEARSWKEATTRRKSTWKGRPRGQRTRGRGLEPAGGKLCRRTESRRRRWPW